MKRVAFVLGNLARGGAERQALDLAVALRAVGWETVFLLAECRGELLGEARAHGFTVVDLRARHWLAKNNPLFWWNCVAVIARIRTAARRHRCSVVQAWSFWEEVLAVPAALLTPGVRMIVSCRQNTAAALGGRWHYRVLQRLANAFVDLVVCTSPAVRAEVLRSERMPARKVRMIPNGVAVERFGRPRARTAFGWPDGAVVVGMLANFKKQKRHDVFIDAFARAVREEPSLCAVLGGSDLGTEFEVRVQIERLGLGDCVHLAGAVERPEEFLAAIDVAALSSDYEGLPVALLEAMAAGLPIVATRVAGTESLVVQGRTGLLVPPGNAREFAAALVRMARSPDKRRSMGARGKARVVSHFSIGHAAAKYAALYQKENSGKPAHG